MMSDISFPRYIYQQDAQPTGAITGALWVDTNASPITTYVYSGSSWVSLTTNVDYVADLLLQQSLNILINAVAASSTLNDYDEIFVDEFTDASGTSNTIETAGDITTALYDLTNKKYLNSTPMIKDTFTRANSDTVGNAEIGAAWTEAGGGAAGVLAIDTNRLKVTADGANVNQAEQTFGAEAITEISYKVMCADISKVGGKCYLYNGANQIVHMYRTASKWQYYDGAYKDVGATPTNNVWDKFTIKNFNWGTKTCDIYVNDVLKITGASFPVAVATATKLVFGVPNVGDTVDYFDDIVMIGATLSNPVNSIVKTTMQTITAGTLYHQIYCHKTIAGSGTITYDISLDNGSTWDTGQVLNTKNPFGATTGTQMIIKFNLNGVGVGNTAEIEDYGVILYT